MKLRIENTRMGDRKIPSWCSLKVITNKNDILYEAFTEESGESPVGVTLVSYQTYQPHNYRSIMGSKPLPTCRFVEIMLLEVQEQFRNQGIASKLLKTIFYDFPFENIILACTDNNTPACIFYTKMGFKILWVDPTEDAPWFIRRTEKEQKSITEIVDILDNVYSVKRGFITSYTGTKWHISLESSV